MLWGGTSGVLVLHDHDDNAILDYTAREILEAANNGMVVLNFIQGEETERMVFVGESTYGDSRVMVFANPDLSSLSDTSMTFTKVMYNYTDVDSHPTAF